MAGMTRDENADFITPVITKGKAKTTLFPSVCVSTIEPFVADLAGTVGRNGNIFFVVDLTMSITMPVSHLTG